MYKKQEKKQDKIPIDIISLVQLKKSYTYLIYIIIQFKNIKKLFKTITVESMLKVSHCTWKKVGSYRT